MSAVGDPYVELEAFKASVSIPNNATDADVTMALLAASRAVEQCTGRRTFWKDATSTTRAYTATSPGLVMLGGDDTTTVTAVAVKQTIGGTAVALTSSDYFAEPANATVDGLPFTRISAVYGRFGCIPGGVQVTGTFGWPAVPAGVPQLVTIIASKLLKRTREAPWGVVQAGGLDGAAVQLASTDPDARLLLGGLTQLVAA
jgi:hypothetical protein